MKSLALKSSLVISFVVAFFVIGGIILVREKQARSQPVLQVKRYPHEHLPMSAWEPKAQLHADTYQLRKDETLASVARLRYAHQRYADVIKLYNHIENESRIATGTTLRVPDISIILAQEGVTKVVAAEVELILCSRAKYDSVLDQLRDRRPRKGGGYEIPEEVKRELQEAADDLQQATGNLKAGKAGVSGVPKSMIGQLEQCMGGMRELALGEHEDPNGYDTDLVRQHYALALAYAIIWARAGFK
jgi:hypothetical protein